MRIRRIVFDSLCVSFLLLTGVGFLTPIQEDSFLQNPWWVSFGLLGLLLVGLLLSGGAVLAHARTLGAVLFEEKVGARPVKKTGASLWVWQLWLTLGLIVVVAIVKTEVSFNELLDQDGFSGAVRLFQGLLDPNWSLLPKAILNITETIFMAFLATLLSLPLAFVLSFLCARNIMKGAGAFGIYLGLRTFLNIVRSVEALIWAIIFSVWVGIGPFAGMLALMIHSIASLAKQCSEIVESAEEGPVEAIESTGANRLQTIWYAIVPQVMLPFISFTVYRWDINVRMATIIGLVGGGGIGTMLVQYQGQAMWREVGCIIFVIAVVVWALDQASAYVREALK